MIGRLNGVLFAVLVFLTSFLGSIFIIIPFVPVAYFAPLQFRWIADRLVGYWLTFPASLVEFVFACRFYITGDLIERDEPAIIIMNHRTRLDWLFLWNALYKMDPWLLTTEKITLKAGLKRIFGAGWAMGCGAFLFLERNFDKDRGSIQTLVKYYKDCGRNYQVLLFPEGTDRDTRSIALSNAFADAQGLPHYDYVLHPRITGFQYLLDLMRKNGYIKYVYDVTVAYPEQVIQSEMALLKDGLFPGAVCFDIQKISADSIPSEKDACERWINDRWRLKESRLKSFYNGERKFEPSVEKLCWPVKTRGIGYVVAFSWWVFTSIMWLYFTYQYLFVKLYVIGGTVFYVYALRKFNGVEFLIVKWFYDRHPGLKREG